MNLDDYIKIVGATACVTFLMWVIVDDVRWVRRSRRRRREWDEHWADVHRVTGDRWAPGQPPIEDRPDWPGAA